MVGLGWWPCMLTGIRRHAGQGLGFWSFHNRGWCQGITNASLSQICSCVFRNSEDRICPKCRGDDPQSVSPGSLVSQEKVRWHSQERAFVHFLHLSRVRPRTQLLTQSLAGASLFVLSLDCIWCVNSEGPDNMLVKQLAHSHLADGDRFGARATA